MWSGLDQSEISYEIPREWAQPTTRALQRAQRTNTPENKRGHTKSSSTTLGVLFYTLGVDRATAQPRQAVNKRLLSTAAAPSTDLVCCLGCCIHCTALCLHAPVAGPQLLDNCCRRSTNCCVLSTVDAPSTALLRRSERRRAALNLFTASASR